MFPETCHDCLIMPAWFYTLTLARQEDQKGECLWEEEGK